ncbi:DUF4358 domain-containing protein [Bacillus sp. FJAT-28004]|uniref:DUF4358 domain-containing protein n=1 Tax=Bacillus sp. FJAT-28004 TaxID=1679165 RepID=UPI0006B691E2|nr:DUF4358 domain-containing protein [Bacillus sp. FJAT-28004]
MFMLKTRYFSVITIVILITVISAGCSNAGKQTNKGESSTSVSGGVNATDKPIETTPPAEDITTEEPTATSSPTDAAATVTPAPTKVPAKNDEAAATAEPTKKPAASAKPLPTVQPTKKPVTDTPTEKPIIKPTATPKPSSLPIATASPSPKPTSKPNPGNPSTEVTVADIAAKLTADAGLGPLTAVEGEQIQDSYGIDPETMLVDGIFYQPTIMIQAGEFSVVQLKSEKDFSDIEALFKKRAEAIQKAFETYVQDQYEQALNYQIIQNGPFVLFSITPDQQKTAEIFNAFFKKKS